MADLSKNIPEALTEEQQKRLRTQQTASAAEANTAVPPLATGQFSVYKPPATNTSIAYSGSDVSAYIVAYGRVSKESFIPLTNLAALSYSIHRDKSPVRKLGHSVAHDYTKGTRTIAGSIVIINFDRAAFFELVAGVDIYGTVGANIHLADSIPPFDLLLMFNEENKGRSGAAWHTGFTGPKKPDKAANYSYMWLRNIHFVDEGAVTGTDEAYLETTFQYVAEDIEYLKPDNIAPVTSDVSAAQAAITTAPSTASSVPRAAEPYRLFTTQVDETAIYTEYTETLTLTLPAGSAENTTRTFTHTDTDIVDNADRVSITKAQNNLWTTKTTFNIANPPLHFSNAEIQSLEVKASASSGEVIANYATPVSSATPLSVDTSTGMFELEGVYFSSADALINLATTTTTSGGAFFGMGSSTTASVTPAIPEWGNKFIQDFHNIGELIYETNSEVLNFNSTPEVGTSTSSSSASGIDFTWTVNISKDAVSAAPYTGADPADTDNHLTASASGQALVATSGSAANEVVVTIPKTMLEGTSTADLSYTVPRSLTSYEYEYHNISNDNVDVEIDILDANNGEEVLPLLSSAFMQNPQSTPDFFDVTIPNYPDLTNSIVLTSYDKDTGILKASLPPAPLVPRDEYKSRGGPGILSYQEDLSVDPAVTGTGTLTTTNGPSLVDAAVGIIAPSLNGIYGHLALSAHVTSADVTETAIDVTGFDSAIDGTATGTKAASTNITSSVLAGVFSFTASSPVEQFSYTDAMVGASSVTQVTPDLSALPSAYPPAGLAVTSSDLTSFTLNGGRSPFNKSLYFNESVINSSGDLLVESSGDFSNYTFSSGSSAQVGYADIQIFSAGYSATLPLIGQGGLQDSSGLRAAITGTNGQLKVEMPYNINDNNLSVVIANTTYNITQVEINFQYIYTGPIPFDIEYTTTLETQASWEANIPLSEPNGMAVRDIENIAFVVNSTNSSGVTTVNTDATCSYNATTNAFDVGMLLPADSSDISITYEYKINEVVTVPINYVSEGSGTYLEEIVLDFGNVEPLSMQNPANPWDPSELGALIMTCKDSGATIIPADFGVTISPATLDASGNYTATVSNIPAFVAVTSGVPGWLNSTWDFVTMGLFSNNTPVGNLRIQYSFQTSMDEGDTPGSNNMLAKIEFHYPTESSSSGSSGAYVGHDIAKGDVAINDFIKVFNYTAQDNSGDEQRRIDDTGSITATSHQALPTGGAPPFIGSGATVTDVTPDYSTAGPGGDLHFNISGASAVLDDVELLVSYDYTVMNLPVTIDYINSTQASYPDLTVALELEYTSEILQATSTAAAQDMDIISEVIFKNAATSTDTPVTAIITEEVTIPADPDVSGSVDLVDAILNTSDNTKAYYLQAGRKNLVFPTGLVPGSSPDDAMVETNLGLYEVEVTYETLTEYTPPSEYTRYGYVLTALLNAGNIVPGTGSEAFEVALKLDQSSKIIMNTEDDLDARICNALEGAWGSTIDPLTGETIDSGVCDFSGGTITLQDLISQQKLVQFSYWLVLDSTDSNGFYEIYRAPDRYVTINEAADAMIAEYNKRAL